MKEELLSKFVRLMNTKISASDLELISLGEKLGLNLVSFVDLRASQEEKFADTVRQKALEKLEKNQDNYLPKKDLFYAGSIDFMVCDEPDSKKFFLLETNGGSNRGLSIITEKQQSIMYDGYFEAILQALNSNKRDDKKLLILVGVPIGDGLIHEKVIMIEYFRKKLIDRNLFVGIYDINDFKPKFEEDIIFLIADYRQLSKTLSFSDNWIKIKNSNVSVLIGDGIARRIKSNDFIKLAREDFRKINSIIVNPIFRITDDKSLTYLASYYAKDILKKYNLKYLLFTKAYTESELIEKLKFIIKKYKRPFIIKPDGGSGGAGVIPIGPNEDPSNIKHLIEESKKEFFAKFMKDRNPYPYTIQEMASFNTIKWKNNGQHTYDIRLYLAQKEGKIIPIGGLARIARGSYRGTLDKQEFVVNLSGYDGQIEVERGCGFSEKNAKLLDLNIDDFVNIFCIGCTLFASMSKNYQNILNFTDWNQIIGEK